MTPDINNLALAYAAAIVSFYTVQIATPVNATPEQRRAYVEERSKMFAAYRALQDAGLRDAIASNANNHALSLSQLVASLPK